MMTLQVKKNNMKLMKASLKVYLNVWRAHISSDCVKYVVAGAGQSNDIPLRVPATAQYSWN